MELRAIQVEKPDDVNVIIGQAHFIKTIEDVHEALAGSAPGLAFGVGFCESSGPRLVRRSGNDPELTRLAAGAAEAIGAGHAFVVFLRNGFPVNVLNALKLVPEVCSVFCATANPVSVVIAAVHGGRAILGVVDGGEPTGIETEADVAERKGLLRKFGYKL